jgi:hypothetical protein
MEETQGLYKNRKNNRSNFNNLLLMTFIGQDDISLTKTYLPRLDSNHKNIDDKLLILNGRKQTTFSNTKTRGQSGF